MATATAQANIPPQNIDAEESVLGAMMVSETSIDPVMLEVRLKDEDFYLDKHRRIFNAIKRLHEQTNPVDALTVADALSQQAELDEAGGKDYIQSLVSTVRAAGNARHYGRIVKQHALLRRIRTAAHQILQSVEERTDEPERLAEQAEAMLFRVAHTDSSSDFKQLHDILDREVTKLEALSRGDLEMTGTPSGFRDLDNLTGGFQPANLIVIAARPSMGKSALVANIAENVAAKHDKAVAFFSLEMSETELAQRFIATRARISSDKLRKGKVSTKDWPRVLRACNELAQAPLYIDDSSDIGMLELRAKARRLHSQEQARGGLGLVIVDYLQLMRPEDSRANRVEQVAQISRGLKILARELDVPVIGISQLSRAPEQRPDKRPILSDLRESGQIEQDSDVVAFIYRDEYYNREESEDQGIAEVIVAKHRNGPTGIVKLVFLESYPRFADRAREERPLEKRPSQRPAVEPDDAEPVIADEAEQAGQ
ncbi:MAG: replicative helicase [Solirubrobacterales bacterium]|nr:replicative helicase [Solirubrobacterales bacterium]MDX6663360.1 replicative helicase [Solirubrobacterales bacterium]